jgi:phage shock protein PspC (stress-responsive transcriptional regulator)
MKDRLFRSRKERVIGGVCGGLAEYFGIDPIIIRIIFVVLLIGKGVGLLAYLIMWVAIPEEPLEHYYARFKQAPGNSNPSGGINPEGENQGPQHEFAQPADYSAYMPKKNNGGLVFGIGLIGLGLLFLFWTLIPSFEFELFFPILLVVLGAFLIFNSLKK